VRRLARRALTAAVVAALAACVSPRAQSASNAPAPAPDLRGRTVMILPAQPGREGAPAGFDAELEYWLADLAPGVRWISPAAVERAVARTPEFAIELRALSGAALVGIAYRRGERIGDPLYGDLRRAGALVDARYALLPVVYASSADGAGRGEVTAALIDTMGGGVLWYATVAGEAGAEAAIASAAQALARTFSPARP
jgi:hypothetical protein